MPQLDIVVDWVDGTPRCTEDRCPTYDGKRCRLLGYSPSYVCEPTVHAILRHDQPLNLFDMVERLADATRHLLAAHDCDCDGHERRAIARDAALAWLKAVKR